MECGKNWTKLWKMIRLMLVLDAVRGLGYNNANRVLHRDGKLDNVLFFSLDRFIADNRKLTDFGSSRNVNLLMTNMTFTKCIRMMAIITAEVLFKNCQRTGDFSPVLMPLQCFNRGDAFWKAQFKFPMLISVFVNTWKSRWEACLDVPQCRQALCHFCLQHSMEGRFGSVKALRPMLA